MDDEISPSDDIPEPAVEDNNPFSPRNAPSISLVVQMRQYDVLMAILAHFDEEAADKLMELHEQGGLLCDLPWLNPEKIQDPQMPE